MNTETSKNIVVDVEADEILLKQKYLQRKTKKVLASKAIKAMKWDAPE